MEEKSFEFLQDLLNSSSPSGFEESASTIWRRYLEKEGFVVKGDTYGNSSAVIGEGGKPRILLAGHIDEIGFMVNYINDEGFIYLSPIGGIDPYIMPAQKVTIYNKDGPVQGVIGQKPIHLQDDDDEKDVKIHNMFVDIGAIDKEDALRFVSIGDPVTFDSEFTVMSNDKIVARGIDDRIGAWCVAECLRILKKYGCFKVEVTGLASVQEENGFYGATMGVRDAKPDLALVVDVAHSTDVPDITKERWGDVKLGAGPVVMVGSVVHKVVSKQLLQIAEDNVIPVQVQTESQYSGTDADAIFMERGGGIPTGIVGIPNRYMHSPVEVIQLDDLKNAVKLMVAWCRSVFPLEDYVI